MKRIFIVLMFFVAVCKGYAQYDLLYFSDDSIPKLEYDADFLFRQHKYDESSAIYRKLLKIDSLKANSFFMIAVNYYYSEKFDSSFFYLDKAMNFGYDSLKIFNEKLFIYENRMHDYKKAESLLNEMIKIWPRNTVLYRKRASYHLRLRRDVDAYKRDMRTAVSFGDSIAKEQLEYYDRGVRAYKKSMEEKAKEAE
ncbi:MAG: hypothetical protein K9H26_04660 [Prolixibacteraceae bacterium]|nr:hypothetical protein [Prolixibacteraceae bacterium]